MRNRGFGLLGVLAVALLLLAIAGVVTPIFLFRARVQNAEKCRANINMIVAAEKALGGFTTDAGALAKRGVFMEMPRCPTNGLPYNLIKGNAGWLSVSCPNSSVHQLGGRFTSIEFERELPAPKPM